MNRYVLFCTLVLSINFGFAADSDSKPQTASEVASHAKGDDAKKRLDAENKKKVELYEQAIKCYTGRAYKDGEKPAENVTASVTPGDSRDPLTNGKKDGAALVAQYCLSCHGKNQAAFSSNGAAHERVSASTMPPLNKPQPSPEERAEIVKYLAGK